MQVALNRTDLYPNETIKSVCNYERGVRGDQRTDGY